MAKVLPACLLVAALSLVLPSEPSYDPWAWLVWGREIPFLDLNTLGGPSWKPLPVAFTVMFAPFGKLKDCIPPALWILVARTGALLALALAWELKVPPIDVEAGRGKAVVFRTDARISSPKTLPPWLADRRVLARVGKWRVFESPLFTLFSHSMQG